MKTTTFLIISVVAGTLAVSVAAYAAYYAVKADNARAITPAEAWIAARFNRHALDRELDRIMKDSEVR